MNSLRLIDHLFSDNIQSLFALLVLLPLICATLPASGETPTGTGLDLAQRRALKQYQEKTFPVHEKAIRDAVSSDLQLVVDWEKLALKDKAEHYNEPEFFDQTIFEPLAAALKEVGSDEMGKTALKEKLKKVHVTLNPDTAPATNYPTGVTFEGGVLTINFMPYSNAGGPESESFKERVKAIVGALIPGL